jgi:hypothetical protein
MGFVSEYINVFKRVLTEPDAFFEQEDRTNGFAFPIRFAAVSSLIYGVLGAVRTLIFGAQMGIEQTAIPGLAAFSVVLTPIVSLIGIFISAGLIHIFVSLFGGEGGYEATAAVMCYATALSVVVSALYLIPLLGALLAFVLAFYGIYIQARGLEHFHDISLGKGIASVIIPAVILLVIVLVLMFTLFAGFVALSAPLG